MTGGQRYYSTIVLGGSGAVGDHLPRRSTSDDVVNATALETLERRLDATRRALIGEQERLAGAVEQAVHAAGYVTQIEDGIRKSEQIIADLTEALDELRGWPPRGETIITWVGPQIDTPCPSCGALSGDQCRSPNGEPVEPHATRGAPT